VHLTYYVNLKSLTAAHEAISSISRSAATFVATMSVSAYSNFTTTSVVYCTLVEIYDIIHSFTHSFMIQSLTYTQTHSPTHPLTHSLKFTLSSDVGPAHRQQ